MDHQPRTSDKEDEAQKWYRDRWLISIMLGTMLLGLIYNFVILLGYGPDEPRHMRYVELLLNEHQLPYLEPDGSEHAGAHTLHPPLYYAILLPFYALLRALPGAWEWHAVRLVSLAFCLATLPLIYQIAERAAGNDKRLARLAVAQVALLPIFAMTAGTINNDSATVFAVTLFLWLLAVKYPTDRSVKAAVVLGLCFGLGGLCKATTLICDGAAFVIYLLAQDGRMTWRAGHAWKRLGIVLLLVAIIAGPWYLRNLNLYGQFTPIERGYSLADKQKLLPSLDHGLLIVVMHPNFPHIFFVTHWSLFVTTWFQKDWIPGFYPGLADPLQPPDWRTPVYLAFAAYCALAAVGFVRGRKGSRSTPQATLAPPDANEPDAHEAAARIARWSSAGAFAFSWLACIVIALFVHYGWASGGRYLLPSLSGLSIFLARGWQGILGASRLPALTVVWSIALIALNGGAIYWLLSFLNPTYGPQG